MEELLVFCFAWWWGIGSEPDAAAGIDEEEEGCAGSVGGVFCCCAKDPEPDAGEAGEGTNMNSSTLSGA